jgi:hypothetical protein
MSVKKKITHSEKMFVEQHATVKAGRYSDFRNILIRIPIGILNEIDQEIQKKPWINRTQWIVEAIHEKLTDQSDADCM